MTGPLAFFSFGAVFLGRCFLISSLVICVATVLGAHRAEAEETENQRFAASAFAMPSSGQEGTKGAWLGAQFGFSPIPGWLTLVAGTGYVAVGDKPGHGYNALAPVAGAEFAVPVFRWLSPFVRGLAGPVFEVSHSNFVKVPPAADINSVLVSIQVGARFRYFELFGCGGAGPAPGANFGLGISFVLPVGLGDGQENGQPGEIPFIL